MAPEQLQNASKKELTDRARALGIAGYTSMRKDDLVRAITRAMKKKAKDREKAKTAKSKAAPAPAPSLNGRYHSNGKPAGPAVPVAKKGKPEVKKSETAAPAQSVPGRPPRNLQGGSSKDRIVVVVRDPYWLHAFWELTHQSVQRAEAALGQDWHGARPILRVFDVSAQDTTSTAEAAVRDVDIHGGCNNW